MQTAEAVVRHDGTQSLGGLVRSGWLRSAVLAIVVLLATFLAAGCGPAGSSTPRAAADSYLRAVASGDLEGARRFSGYGVSSAQLRADREAAFRRADHFTLARLEFLEAQTVGAGPDGVPSGDTAAFMLNGWSENASGPITYPENTVTIGVARVSRGWVVSMPVSMTSSSGE